jgi:hypothetical protein
MAHHNLTVSRFPPCMPLLLPQPHSLSLSRTLSTIARQGFADPDTIRSAMTVRSLARSLSNRIAQAPIPASQCSIDCASQRKSHQSHTHRIASHHPQISSNISHLSPLVHLHLGLLSSCRDTLGPLSSLIHSLGGPLFTHHPLYLLHPLHSVHSVHSYTHSLTHPLHSSIPHCPYTALPIHVHPF